MTKEEFKAKYVDSGLLTWHKVDTPDIHFMYNDLHFTDRTVAELFELPMEQVIKKRKESGAAIKKEDYSAFLIHKEQGRLNWDEVHYHEFDYLYNICQFTDSTLADLFDVPKKEVTAKRKRLGITMFDSLGPYHVESDVSSYLDFIDTSH